MIRTTAIATVCLATGALTNSWPVQAQGSQESPRQLEKNWESRRQSEYTSSELISWLAQPLSYDRSYRDSAFGSSAERVRHRLRVPSELYHEQLRERGAAQEESMYKLATVELGQATAGAGASLISPYAAIPTHFAIAAAGFYAKWEYAKSLEDFMSESMALSHELVEDYLAGSNAGQYISENIQRIAELYLDTSDEKATKTEVQEAIVNIINEDIRASVLREITDPDEQDRVLQYVDSHLLTAAFGAITENAAQIAANVRLSQQATGLARKNAEKLVYLGRAFSTFQKEKRDSLQGLNWSMSVLTSEVERNTNRLEIVSKLIFARLTPSEQLEALQSGMLGSLSEDARKSLEVEIKSIEARRAFVVSVQNVLGKTKILNDALRIVGADPFITDVINKAVGYGSSANSLINAISSGDYFAAVGVISSLFGPGRPDPTMQMLNRMDGKIDKLLDGQKAIMNQLAQAQNNQKIMFDALKQIAVQNSALIELVYIVRNDVLRNRVILKNLLNKEVSQCRDFLDLMDKAAAYSSDHYRLGRALFAYKEQL